MEGKATDLIQDTLDVEVFSELEIHRLVLFDASRLLQHVSAGALETYFNKERNKVIGGRHYNVNCSFILLIDKYLPIDKPLLKHYDSQALIYYLKLDTVDMDYLASIRANTEEEVINTKTGTKGKISGKLVDNKELQRVFFTSLVISANGCYHHICNTTFSPPQMPEELLDEEIIAKPRTVEVHIYKSVDAKLAQKDLFVEFMRRQVVIKAGLVQTADDFRDIFYEYLDRMGGNRQDFKASGLGRRLANYLKDNSITSITNVPKFSSGKFQHVYDGLMAYK